MLCDKPKQGKRLLFTLDPLKLLSAFPLAPNFNDETFIFLFYKEIRGFRSSLTL